MATVLTEAQYLEIERKAECKSEFFGGEMFAMAGGSLAHGILQMEVGSEINTRLAGRGCRAFGSDVKIKIVATGLYTYPDLSIVCGRPKTTDEHKDTITNPIVIVEVLSPSTEAYDRGKMRIERFTRGEDNTWTLRPYVGNDAVLRIDAIDVSIPLETVCRGVDFEDAT